MNRIVVAAALVLSLAAACGGPLPSPLDESSAALTGAPVISALNRTGSPPEGGMTILVIGTNLDPAASVQFAGVDALSVTTDPNATSTASSNLVVVTPPHAEGFVDLVVTNPDGQQARYASFHYGPPPSISGFSPASGVRRGDQITITGANFASVGGVQVTIGGAVAQLVSKSSTQLVVAAPKLNGGLSYQVVVTNFDSQYAVAQGVLAYRP